MDPRRRFFLRGALTPGASRAAPPALPRPPWALADEAAFTARCTRCGECSRVCPRALIRPGDGGFPEIRFTERGCDECGACRAACPSGALQPPPPAPAVDTMPAFRWRIQVAPTCLAQHRVECRVCAESCDTGALRCRPALGGISQLVLDPAACTGCGECLAPCPVGALSLAVPEAGSEAA